MKPEPRTHAALRAVWAGLLTRTDATMEDLQDPTLQEPLETLWARISHHILSTTHDGDTDKSVRRTVEATVSRFSADFLSCIEGGRHE